MLKRIVVSPFGFHYRCLFCLRPTRTKVVSAMHNVCRRFAPMEVSEKGRSCCTGFETPVECFVYTTSDCCC